MASKTVVCPKRESLRSEMFQLMAEYECSGLTQKAFITSRGLKRSRFYYWLGRYRSDHSSRPAPADFIPVKIPTKVVPKENPAVHLTPIEVHLPNGTHIVLDSRTPAAYLLELIGGS